jgi:toxin ParE1/3/4
LSAGADRFFFTRQPLEIFGWRTVFYRERARDIAADFVDAIDVAIATIVAAPQRWPIKNGWHRYRIHRFPFTIAYREAGDLIEIGAIAHHKRRPDYWIRRRR